MKKLYIDIDGVLLTIKNTQQPPFAVEFIDFITSSFDCYWLTTHCKAGDNYHIIQYLSPYYNTEIIDKLKGIKPTSWGTAKTDAIDFNSDFYWIDDYIFEFEKNILKRHHKMSRWIEVNLNQKNDLKRVKELLKSKT